MAKHIKSILRPDRKPYRRVHSPIRWWSVLDSKAGIRSANNGFGHYSRIIKNANKYSRIIMRITRITRIMRIFANNANNVANNANIRECSRIIFAKALDSLRKSQLTKTIFGMRVVERNHKTCSHILPDHALLTVYLDRSF